MGASYRFDRSGEGGLRTASGEPSPSPVAYRPRMAANNDLNTVLAELRHSGGLVIPHRYAAKSRAFRAMAVGKLVVSAFFAVLGGIVMTEGTRHPN